MSKKSEQRQYDKHDFNVGNSQKGLSIARDN